MILYSNVENITNKISIWSYTISTSFPNVGSHIIYEVTSAGVTVLKTCQTWVIHGTW